MTDTQARARVWTLYFYALVFAALTGPLAALLTPLAHASALALPVVAAVLAALLVGASCAPTQPTSGRCTPATPLTAARHTLVLSCDVTASITARLYYESVGRTRAGAGGLG